LQDNKPFMTVMLLARERLMGMIKTLHSFIDEADNVDDIEFLVGLDFDDIFCITELQSYQNRVWPNIQFRYHIFEKRRPWGELYECWNQMAADAKGEWLHFATDDMCNTTKHWDKIVKDRYRGKFVHIRTMVFDGMGGHTHPCATVPYVNRKFYDIMGHVAHNMQIDLWMGDIATDLGFQITYEDLTFWHEWDKKNVPNYTCDKFYNEDKPLWEEDKRKVKDYLDSLSEEEKITT
jgi:hypothetical protein